MSGDRRTSPGSGELGAVKQAPHSEGDVSGVWVTDIPSLRSGRSSKAMETLTLCVPALPEGGGGPALWQLGECPPISISCHLSHFLWSLGCQAVEHYFISTIQAPHTPHSLSPLCPKPVYTQGEPQARPPKPHRQHHASFATAFIPADRGGQTLQHWSRHFGTRETTRVLRNFYGK